MKENIIITLETNENYIILHEIFFEEQKYYVGMKIEENLSVKSGEIKFFEIDKYSKELNLFIVEDEKLLLKLVQIAKRM